MDKFKRVEALILRERDILVSGSCDVSESIAVIDAKLAAIKELMKDAHDFDDSEKASLLRLSCMNAENGRVAGLLENFADSALDAITMKSGGCLYDQNGEKTAKTGFLRVSA